MKQYLDLLQKVLQEGVEREDRTGVGTRSIFGYQFRCDLQRGFPLLTTKRVFFKGVVEELLWFLEGNTNVKSLQERNIHIWDAWANEEGELGPIYGFQWRNWRDANSEEGIDQIDQVIQGIREQPYSRRHIVSAWNVADIHKMALPPCHLLFQFYVANGRLSCQLYQRSADVFLGVPFNIASYSLLTLMVAQVTGLQPGEFIHTFGDVHLYLNHLDQAKKQLSREPSELPQVRINENVRDLFEFKFEDIELISYHPQSTIKAPIAV